MAAAFLAVFGASRPAVADGPAAPRLVPELTPPFGPKDQTNDAPTAADSWASRNKTLNVQGGSAGGPLGYGGVSFEYAPIPWIVGGIGAGVTGQGATAAFMPRLRLPLTRSFAFGMGFPVSAGPYEAIVQMPETCSIPGCQVGFRTTRTWDLAFWVHFEPNVEIRVGKGMALRLYAGQSYLLNHHDDRCTSTLRGGCPSSYGEQRWYAGGALGYAW